MTVTLLGSWAKHEQAMEHYATLAVESEAYLRQVQFSAEVVTTPEGGVEPQFYAEPQPPSRLGTIVGDVVHNLRSALDVAAWQLAIDHDEAKARDDQLRIQFPLTRNPEEFQEAQGPPVLQRGRATGTRPPAAISTIEPDARLASGAIQCRQASARNVRVPRNDCGAGPRGGCGREVLQRPRPVRDRSGPPWANRHPCDRRGRGVRTAGARRELR